jgi:hypothetical protein
MRVFGFVLSGALRLGILVEGFLLSWLGFADQGKPALSDAQPRFFIGCTDRAIRPVLGLSGLLSVLVISVHGD